MAWIVWDASKKYWNEDGLGLLEAAWAGVAGQAEVSRALKRAVRRGKGLGSKHVGTATEPLYDATLTRMGGGATDIGARTI